MVGDITKDVRAKLQNLTNRVTDEMIDLVRRAEDTLEAAWRDYRRNPWRGREEPICQNALQISESLARKVSQRLNQYYEARRKLMIPVEVVAPKEILPCGHSPLEDNWSIEGHCRECVRLDAQSARVE